MWLISAQQLTKPAVILHELWGYMSQGSKVCACTGQGRLCGPSAAGEPLCSQNQSAACVFLHQQCSCRAPGRQRVLEFHSVACLLFFIIYLIFAGHVFWINIGLI